MSLSSWPLIDTQELTPDVETGSKADAGAVARRNFLLNADGDMDVSSGNFAFARGLVAIQQSLKSRLQAVRGEWFLNVALGLPLFEEIIGKSPSLVAIRALYRTTIEETPGVKQLLELRLSLSAERVLTVAFKVNTDFGELADVVPLENSP